MRDLVRNLARRVAPQLVANRARRYERQFRAERGIPELARRLEPVVQAGPSRGLRYPPERFEEIDAPVSKLLGIYELELHEILETAASSRRPFFDIGTADGYWAVGLALRGCPVVGWDLSPNARELCSQVAALNGVTIDLRTEYSGEPLPDGLVLCDIEGAERDLLTADVARGLPDVLVEVHEDPSRRGIGDTLVDAFAQTHEARRIEQEPRAVPPAIAGWTPREQQAATAEFRPAALHWLHFTRRNGAG